MPPDDVAAPAAADATPAPAVTADASKPAAEGSQGKTDAVSGKDNKPAAVSVADWRDGLQGEEAELAKRFTTPADAVKFAAEQRKEISTRIRIPDKNAKPEDIAKFNKALGAGENADAYQTAFPKPEGRDLSDTEKLVQTKVSEVLHKHHVPIAAAGELHNVVQEIAKGIEEEKERVALKGRETNDAALRKEWGSDYDANRQLATRAAKAFGGEQLLEFAGKSVIDGVKLGDHPEFLRVFGQVGRRMGEGSFIGAVGEAEQATMDDEIVTKTRAMHAAHGRGDRMTAQRINNELMELQGRRHGHAPVVGRGRAV